MNRFLNILFWPAAMFFLIMTMWGVEMFKQTLLNTLPQKNPIQPILVEESQQIRNIILDHEDRIKQLESKQMTELESKDKINVSFNKNNRAIISFSAYKSSDLAAENCVTLTYDELNNHIKYCKYIQSLFPQYLEDVLK